MEIYKLGLQILNTRLNAGLILRKPLFFTGLFLFTSAVFFINMEFVWGQEDKRSELELQIEQLEQEAAALDQDLSKIQGDKNTLANELAGLDTEIKQRNLSIKKVALVLKQAALAVERKSESLEELSKKINKSKDALAYSLTAINKYDEEDWFTVLLKNTNLASFLFSVNNLNKVITDVEKKLTDFKEEKSLLEKEKMELEDFQAEQENLKVLQEVERRFLAQKKYEKEEIIRLTKGKESLFQQLLQLKKRDISSLKTQLFYLEKTGISAEDAVRFADLAAKRAGIRTSFLLALLEVETGKQFEDGIITAGTNLGTGNWKKDLYNCYIRLGKKRVAEAEKRAFFEIMGKLGLDPDQMPVSRRPSYGCGGAMGPAQFLPTTWLRFEDKVAELTGHTPPNPWSIEDAFTASAIFLAEAGAFSQTEAGEVKAAKTYISGNPNCRKYICRSYSNRIISLAKDIGRVL